MGHGYLCTNMADRMPVTSRTRLLQAVYWVPGTSPTLNNKESNDMCSCNMKTMHNEFDRILFEAEVDLLDGSLETNKLMPILYTNICSTVPLQCNSDLAKFLPNPENLGYRLPTWIPKYCSIQCAICVLQRIAVSRTERPSADCSKARDTQIALCKLQIVQIPRLRRRYINRKPIDNWWPLQSRTRAN